jgi:hypothetical protein
MQEGLMKKLRLDLDTLAVDSFEIDDGAKDDGTVIGHASEDTNCQTACFSTCYRAQCTPLLTVHTGCSDCGP